MVRLANVDGECNARLYIDDAAFRCALTPDHNVPHQVQIEHQIDYRQNYIVVEWTLDERDVCAACEAHVEDIYYCETCDRDLCAGCFGAADVDHRCDKATCAACLPGHACSPDDMHGAADAFGGEDFPAED